MLVPAASALGRFLRRVNFGHLLIRGCLYAFHQLTGAADFKLGAAAAQLRASGHTDLADELDEQLVGRNVIGGRWTFQLVEDYDDNYWSLFRTLEKQARDQLVAGRRHLYEAALKEDRRTHGSPGHEALPSEGTVEA